MTTTLENLPSQRPRPDSERRRLLPDERARLGKAARESAPLGSHAAFDRAPDAPDPVALLEQQGESRIPDLVPVRYGRMLVSPFTYYRGAALRTAVASGHITALSGV